MIKPASTIVDRVLTSIKQKHKEPFYSVGFLDAESIAKSLPKGRRLKANSFVACCPAHNDLSPSLHITQKGEKVLVHCFAGCTQNEVIEALRALGLWHKQLTGFAPRRTYSDEELLELFLFVAIVHNSINRTDLPQATKSDYSRARHASDVLKRYGFDIQQARRVVAMLGGRHG